MEIARYGTLKSWAKQLGMNEAVTLLDATLQEEIATDQKLTALGENTANAKGTGQSSASAKGSMKKAV